MKNLIITSVIALGVAVPAVAQTQLEKQAGVEAGKYSTNELILLIENDMNDSGPDVYLGNEHVNYSTGTVHNQTADEIFMRLEAEDDNE